MHLAQRVGILICLSQLSFTLLLRGAAEWPKGYVVYESSISPDERYGIVLPSQETGADSETENVNYLADLKMHRLLGKIDGADYFENQNHRGLDVTWSDDSKLAVIVYDERFGFGSAAVLEIKDSHFGQTAIGGQIHKAINSAIAKQSHQRDDGGETSPLFRFEPGPKLRVYATATTNPKQFDDVKTYYALFQGVFDVPTKKWIASAARALTNEEYNKLEQASTAYETEKFKVSPKDFEALNANAEEPQFSGDDIVFRSEESKFKYLDDHINDVYQAVRLLLPPARFAKVKQEQIEWLKKREASTSIGEKSRLTAERIKVLDDLAW